MNQSGSIIKKGIMISLTVFLFLSALVAMPAFAQTCMPVVGSPIDVNGIIAGAGPGLPGGCTVDPGWAGSVGRDFVVYGVPGGPKVVKLFLAGYRVGASANLDTVYLGVHFEGDPDLQAEDRLVLYFDANGVNDDWDADDFALLYEIGTLTPPVNEDCDQTPGTGQIYRYSGGHWAPQGAIPADITTKVSWDYDAANDPETGIWELVLGINVSAMGLKAPASGDGFKLGAKLYQYESGVAAWTMWHWPAADLTTSDDPLLYDPDEGGVVPGKLELVSIGTCGYDVTFDPDGSTGVTATSNSGESNKFTRLDVNNSADFDQATGAAKKKNHFTGRVKFFNPADPADSSPVAVPNSGQVRFSIKPWNSGFIGEYLMNQETVSFTRLNEVKTISFDWPETKTQYSPAQSDLADSHHTCLHVEIDGFTVDSDTTNNEVNRNLTYTALSTVHDSFVIRADRETAGGVKEFEYIVHAGWKNVPPSEVDISDVTGPAQCAKDKWSLKITNAQQIGLTDLGKGYFSVPLKLGETKRVELAITGGAMPVKTKQVTLSPRAGGQAASGQPSGDPPLEVDVDPGSIVTIIASGLVSLDPKARPNGPNGYSEREMKNKPFLLQSGYYNSWENIGAVIATVDKENWFVVGADRTFMVPKDVDRLLIAVNDAVGAYDNNIGDGFELNIVISKPTYLPTRLVSQGNPKFGLPAQMQAGSNLPELDIEVYNAIPVIKQTGQKILKPTGYVSYAVYASHPEDTVPPKPPVCCSPVKPTKVGLSSIMILAGIIVLQRRTVRKEKGKKEEKE